MQMKVIRNSPLDTEKYDLPSWDILTADTALHGCGININTCTSILWQCFTECEMHIYMHNAASYSAYSLWTFSMWFRVRHLLPLHEPGHLQIECAKKTTYWQVGRTSWVTLQVISVVSFDTFSTHGSVLITCTCEVWCNGHKYYFWRQPWTFHEHLHPQK